MSDETESTILSALKGIDRTLVLIFWALCAIAGAAIGK